MRPFALALLLLLVPGVAGAQETRFEGGETREIRFRANTPGTYFYWASTSGEKPSWSETQLAGALVIDSPHATAGDRIFVITGFLREADSSLAVPRPEQAMLAVNGLSWPHTERLTYTPGDSVRWRWISATRVAHPMHLHGFYFHLESRGDWRSEQVYREDERPFLVTNLMLPRETMRIGWRNGSSACAAGMRDSAASSGASQRFKTPLHAVA